MPRNMTVGKISYDELRQIKPNIFEGSCGPRNPVAIKRIHCENLNKLQLRLKEIDRWVQCDNHENVVKYFDVEYDETFIYIAMELCLGNLQEWVNDPNTPFGVISPQKVLCQITKGLANLHAKGIIHRKLKPSNILLNRDNLGNIHAKIADFEVSREIPVGQTSKPVTTGSDETQGWQAPEILEAQYGVYDPTIKEAPATDIFSLGCIFYYVLTQGKQHPFGTVVEERDYRIKHYIPAVDATHFKSTQIGNLALLQNMIAKDRSHRPTMDFILGHHVLWSHKRMLSFISQVGREFEAYHSNEIEAVKTDLRKEYSNSDTAANCLNNTDGWISLMCEDVQIYLKNPPLGMYSGDDVVDIYKAVYNFYKHECNSTFPQYMINALIPDLLSYFLKRFPWLISTLWSVCQALRFPRDPFNLNEYYTTF